jgi:hypothetical protein
MTRTLESLAFGIVYFILLVFLSRNWDSMVKPAAWGIWGLLHHFFKTGDLLFALIFGLILSLLRFALEKGFKLMKGIS